MQFSYVAYSPDQGIVRGRIEAPDEAEVAIAVRRLGLRPVKVKAVRQLPSLEKMFPSFFSVGSGELVRFFKSVATMTSSGGSLLRALEMAEAETKNRMMRATLADMHRRLSNGESLTMAMGAHAKVFGTLYISITEVGETTGRLAPSFEQLAEMLESEQEAKARAIKTMMYPMAIVGLSIVTLGVLMTVAVPPLMKVFAQMGADVPWMTRVAVTGVGAVKNNLVSGFLTAVAGIGSLIAIRHFERGRRAIDTLVAGMPLLGPLSIAGDIARFSRTMALLLESGVSMATALPLSIGGCKNVRIREALQAGEDSLMSGHGFSSELRRHGVLPTLFLELVMMGEEGNVLQRMMNDAAIAYQKQREQRLNALLGALEPISTLAVGGIVGFIAFSMIVPIYSGLGALE